MNYLFSQIAISLVLAAIAGGAFGWLVHRAKSSKQTRALQQVIGRQQQHVNEAQTEVSLIASDFDDLKHRSEATIKSLQQESDKVHTLHQNLENSQLLGRQRNEQHKAEKDELIAANAVLTTKAKLADVREQTIKKLQADLETERRNNAGASKASVNNAGANNAGANNASANNAGASDDKKPNAPLHGNNNNKVSNDNNSKSGSAQNNNNRVTGNSNTQNRRFQAVRGLNPSNEAKNPAPKSTNANASSGPAEKNSPSQNTNQSAGQSTTQPATKHTASSIDATQTSAKQQGISENKTISDIKNSIASKDASAQPNSAVTNKRLPLSANNSATSGAASKDANEATKTSTQPEQASKKQFNAGTKATLNSNTASTPKPEPAAKNPVTDQATNQAKSKSAVSTGAVSTAAVPTAAETEAELKALRDQLAEDAPTKQVSHSSAVSGSATVANAVAKKPDGAIEKQAKAESVPKVKGKTSDKEEGGELELLFDPVDHHDDLKQIFGIGPVTEKTLNKLGITAYSQLAELKQHDIEKIADALQIFPGRIERDNWVGGARAQLEEVLEEL